MPPTPEPTSRNAVWIERHQNRIHAHIPYRDGQGPSLAKTISGSNWSSTIKRWTYPLDLQVCRDFRETFGAELEIGPQLWLWASEARANVEKMAALATQTDAELMRVAEAAPRLAEALSSRTYQRVGARFIADGRNVLIGDQPGLGKTLETLAGLVEIDAQAIIIFAPKTSLRSVWEREIVRWIPNAKTFVTSGSKDARQRTIDAYWDSYQANWDDEADHSRSMHFLICNTEMVRIKTEHECPDKLKVMIKKGRELFEVDCNGKYDYCRGAENHISYDLPAFPELFVPWDAIVCDESHLALLGRKTQTRKGFVKMYAKSKIALSGTPYRGKLENFWGVLNWLNPQTFTSYWKWAERYFQTAEGTFGGIEIGPLMPHRQEAYDNMLLPYVLRRTKAEVASDLPPKMYAGTPLDPDSPESTVGVWLDMYPAQEKSYRDMAREAMAQIDGGFLTANGILAELIRLKQFSSCSWKFEEIDTEEGTIRKPVPTLPSNKFDWLLEFVEERKETGAKVVVASQYTSTINLFADEMDRKGHSSYVLTGDTKEQKRADIIARFQDPADPVQIFFLNTKAGGVAVTLDQADELVFLDETYIPDDQEQVEDRIHRVSRMHNVTIYYLRSAGTVEETICRVTGAREAIIKRRLDGSRGVETARKLING